MLKQKKFEIEVKAVTEDYGTLEGYASTWTRTPDAYGDVVKQGAFTKTLENFRAEGKTIPLIWSHKLDDLDSYIGTVCADEDEKGLHFVAKFDNSDNAQKVRSMYKNGILSKFSFAYNVLDWGLVELEDGKKATELRELEIYEISTVLVPANSDASVVDVKAGKRNSSKDEQTIKDAIELLQQLLNAVKDDIDESNDDEKSEKDGKGNVPETEDQTVLNEKKASLLELIKKIEL